MSHEKSIRQWAARIAKSENYELIHLPCGLSEVGRAGDSVVSDPDHPDEAFRLTVVRPIDPDLLWGIREDVFEWFDKNREVAP